MAKRLVYSSEGGRLCPDCSQPLEDCLCGQETPARAEGPVRVRLETKGRRGKAVTVVTGIPLEGVALADLGKTLRQKCGAGGTVKDGVIEIQGDHRIPVLAVLQNLGFQCPRHK